MRPRLGRLALAAGLLSGCVASDAVNRGYNLSSVKRLGVLSFEYGGHPAFGAEDIFAKHLLERGYQVIERARLEAILKEQRLGASGALSPDTAKRIGRLLGVDALLMGQVTSYAPERKSVIHMETVSSIREEPVFEEREHKGPDGSTYKRLEQVGTRTIHERKQTPQLFAIDAQVGIAVKLVDVETGEIAWVGSDSTEGVNVAVATEWLASYLVKSLSKKWRAAGAG